MPSPFVSGDSSDRWGHCIVHTFKHDPHEKVRGSIFQTLERLAESELAPNIERLSCSFVSKESGLRS